MTEVAFQRRILLAILAVSGALRAILVFRGGQFFFPDEIRYWASRHAAEALWAGELDEALGHLAGADHLLFKVMGTLPASLELVTGPRSFIPALFFALFSVATLWLTWAIVRRVGENERTALFAAGLLALCSTFLYYSRHLVPYDVAMALGLFALFVGLHRPARPADSIGCGLLAATTFLTYNGYWLLAGFAMAAHCLRPPRPFAGVVRRALLTAAAFAAPLAALLAADLATGGDLFRQLLHFSGSVIQGSFAEGAILPLRYFWHAEHGIALLWAAAILAALAALAGGSRKEATLLALGGVAFIYGTLVYCSVGLEKFVVYGRLARQVAPFCCILAALLVEQLWTTSRRGRVAAIALLALATLQAAWNFRQPFAQVFPGEFIPRAAATAAATQRGPYELANAEFIYPEPKAAPAGTVLLRERHPLQFLPLQYESHTPEQRRKLRDADIAMQLILPPWKPEIFADGFESGSAGSWSLVSP